MNQCGVLQTTCNLPVHFVLRVKLDELNGMLCDTVGVKYNLPNVELRRMNPSQNYINDALKEARL